MKTNVSQRTSVFTHEGGPASNVSAYQKLKRLSLACLLWEDNFYVDGKTQAELIAETCGKLSADKILSVASEAMEQGLRHLPLYLILQALKKGGRCADLIVKVCHRPDQMTELLSLYWKDGKKPIPNQMKKGLAQAFRRFDAYQLAKYNRDTPIKLKDVLFLVHAKPRDEEQAELWKKLIANTLPIPQTWEVKLSSGQDKKMAFTELLSEKKMGKLAIIRNMRNMQESGVDKKLVDEALQVGKMPIFPFQYLAAAKFCMAWEDLMDKHMIESCRELPKLKGSTVLFVDVSGSMDAPLSSKSEMRRLDASCGLAILLREVCENLEIYTFSERLTQVPLRSGMALRDAILASQPHSGTYLGNALQCFFTQVRKGLPPLDRCIVITDEQVADAIPKIPVRMAYMLNVGTYENGIKHKGQWETITGFSEKVVDFIRASENES